MWKDMDMLTRLVSIVLGALIAALPGVAALADSPDDNWPNWRGPNADGVAVKGSPPVTWSESENIKWKVELPGTGSSTPVIWGDKIFIQTAIQTGDEPSAPARPAPRRRGPPSTPAPKAPLEFKLICLDRGTGKIIWERTAIEAIPHEGHHPTGSFASYSPVTDGEHVWASFGSRGLYCYDLDGNQKWSTDLIKMRIKLNFGEGSSPALVGDAVVVVMDHEGDSKLMAFNKNTGDLLWETGRQERTSWASPLPVKVGDSYQIITCATSLIRSYDAKTGDLIWQRGGLTANAIPTPVAGFGNVYCTSGFRGYALMAIELGHTGDLSDTDAVVWEVDRGTPYVASPLLYGDRIYVTDSLKPILSCYNALTGAPIFEDQRLSGLKQIYASPVGAGGRIYIADREGTTLVLKQSDSFEVLATNTLDEGFDASPVVIGDELYLKGSNHLYCIAHQ